MKGRKRHIIVDSLGLLLDICITGANWSDRDSSILLFHNVGQHFTKLKKIFADQGYSGKTTKDQARIFTGAELTIVPRLKGQDTFVVLPKRWIVERTFAWIVRSRRLAKDLEYTTASAKAMVQLAMIGIMLRRLA